MAFARLTQPFPLRWRPGTATSRQGSVEVGQEVGCCGLDPCRASACPHLNPPAEQLWSRLAAGVPHYPAQLGTAAGAGGDQVVRTSLVSTRAGCGQEGVCSSLTPPGDGQGESTLMYSGDPSSCCNQMQRFSVRGKGSGLFSQKLMVVPLFSRIFGSASWWEIQSYVLVLEVKWEHLQRGQPSVLPMSSCKAPWCLRGHHQPMALSPPFLLKVGPDMDPGPCLSCLWSWTSRG